MRDQAHNLRVLTRDRRVPAGEEYRAAGPRVVAVTSGKGGVGKTSLVVNLALALAHLGQRVVVFDADLGLANVEVLLGISPPHTLHDVVFGGKSMEEVLVPGPCGIKFISGGSGFQELANLDTAQRERLIRGLAYFQHQADFLLVDTGAGISRNVLGFVAASQEVIVVVTPEPTSLTDAYGLIKVLAKFKVHSHAYLVVNRALDDREAVQTAHKMEMVAGRFLQFRVHHLGSLLEDGVVGQAVKVQQPFVLLQPHGAAARRVAEMARYLVEGYRAPAARGINGFIGRLVRLLG